MLRAALLVSLLFTLALGAHGSPRDAGPGEWVQITFAGRVEPAGGARIELTVDALRDPQGTGELTLSLAPHLGQFTTASDLAALVTQRLGRVGITAWLGDPDPTGERRHLFVERAVLVRLRLGHGLSATVTVCEGAPDSLKIEPPTLVHERAELRVTYSTLHPHTGERRREELSMPLSADTNAARISESLTRQCLDAGLVAERPTQDSWHLVKLADGAGLVGFNVELVTGGDWLLELKFRN